MSRSELAVSGGAHRGWRGGCDCRFRCGPACVQVMLSAATRLMAADRHRDGMRRLVRK